MLNLESIAEGKENNDVKSDLKKLVSSIVEQNETTSPSTFKKSEKPNPIVEVLFGRNASETTSENALNI